MTLLLLNVLPVMATLVLTIVVSKRWTAGSRRNSTLLGLGAALGIHVVFTLIGALLVAPFYRWLEPNDDWWDIVASTTILLNIAGTPIMLILGAMIGYRQHRPSAQNAVCRNAVMTFGAAPADAVRSAAAQMCQQSPTRESPWRITPKVPSKRTPSDNA